MTNGRTRIRVALIAADASALLGFGLVAPAAAHGHLAAGIIGAGSGRVGGSLAAVVALLGAIIGGLALARSRRGGSLTRA